MKDILTEIKNNLQGINSGVDEAKNQINDLEHKEGKDIQSVQQEEKESKKSRIVQGTSGTTSNVPTFASWMCWKEEREQEIGNLFEKIMTENFSDLVRTIDISVQEAQSPKQGEPKEAHTKTHN